MSIIALSTRKYETYVLWLWITTYAFLQPQEVIRKFVARKYPILTLSNVFVREPLVSLDI